LRDSAAALGGVIQQKLIEHRAFNVVSRRVFTPKDITKKKPITSRTTGGNDLSTVLHNHIGFIDLLFDSHPFKGANAAGQKGFSNLETWEPFLLENGYIPAMLGQQRSCSASGRPAADDNDIEELSHGFIRKLYPYGPIDNRTDGKVSARNYVRLFNSNCIAG
jgi:hypothetical protein